MIRFFTSIAVLGAVAYLPVGDKFMLAESNRFQRQFTHECAPRNDMGSYLASKFNESIRATGISGSVTVQLWHSPGGRTWTILIVLESGAVCALANGENWFSRR